MNGFLRKVSADSSITYFPGQFPFTASCNLFMENEKCQIFSTNFLRISCVDDHITVHTLYFFHFRLKSILAPNHKSVGWLITDNCVPSKACHTPFLFKEGEKDVVKEDEKLLGVVSSPNTLAFGSFLVRWRIRRRWL